MHTAQITFADGSSLVLNENDSLNGVTFNKLPRPEGKRAGEMDEWLENPESASEVRSMKLWVHTDVGLFVSVADIIHNYEYFSTTKNPNIRYKSSSVVHIITNEEN